MPDVQALEVRRPRRFLPTAATGSAPVRPHLPLEPPRDPRERLGRSFRADDAALTPPGQLAVDTLRQLRAGELGEEHVPSDEDLEWAHRELGDPATEKPC